MHPDRRPLRPDLTSLDDASVVAAMSQGDDAALAEVYRRHASACYGLAMRLLRDASSAQEVLQEVMIRLWEKPDRFDAAKGPLRPYLLRATHGRCVDRMRSEARRLRRDDAHARSATFADDLDREVWELVRRETVRDAMRELSAEQREAIDLAYFSGLTYREVAAHLSLPEGTVKGRIRLGLAKLAHALEAAGLAPERDRHRP